MITLLNTVLQLLERFDDWRGFIKNINDSLSELFYTHISMILVFEVGNVNISKYAPDNLATKIKIT